MRINLFYRLLLCLGILALFNCSEDSGSRADDAGMDSGVQEDGNDGGGDADADMDADGGMDADLDGGDEDEWPGAPWFGCTDDDEPESASIITAFELADHYFNPGDRRTIETEVDFPENEGWKKIDLKIELACPEDGDCDNWDRFANIMLVENPGEPDEDVFELERYITPYNIGMCILTDVSGFAPLLSGKKTIRSFIDTWVGPDEAVHGHGWRISVKFIFHTEAEGEGVVDEFIQLWPYQNIEVGNPSNPVEGSVAGQRPVVPGDVEKVELRILATGHGQGNLYNCAEFCNLKHVITVNGSRFDHDPWRSDCDENPIGPLQAGTWTHERSGWCPGAYVLPHVFDVTEAINKGEENIIDYSVENWEDDAYVNTCRPDAGNDSGVCEGCEFDNSPGNCGYNGMDHTMPVERISVQMLLYK